MRQAAVTRGTYVEVKACRGVWRARRSEMGSGGEDEEGPKRSRRCQVLSAESVLYTICKLDVDRSAGE